MTSFIVESATETGRSIEYWSLTRNEWVADAALATKFNEVELAERWADDWQDFYAMKGYGRYTNIVEVV